LNLCTLLANTPNRTVTREIYARWLNEKSEKNEPLELHKTSDLFKIPLPPLLDDGEMLILNEDISHLGISQANPYGLTERQIDLLKSASYKTVAALAGATDDSLLSVAGIGSEILKRIKISVAQAIWM